MSWFSNVLKCGIIETEDIITIGVTYDEMLMKRFLFPNTTE